MHAALEGIGRWRADAVEENADALLSADRQRQLVGRNRKRRGSVRPNVWRRGRSGDERLGARRARAATFIAPTPRKKSRMASLFFASLSAIARLASPRLPVPRLPSAVARNSRLLSPPQTNNNPNFSPQRGRALVDAVKAAAPIAEVVEAGGVDVMRLGSTTKARCPFHGGGTERTPSMALNEEAGTYYCFACGASGDQLSFMQEHEGLSFREAVEVLAERYDVPLTADFGRGGGGGGAASKADDKRSRALRAHQLAAEFYSSRLRTAPTPRRAPRCCAGGTARARARSPTASASATRRRRRICRRADRAPARRRPHRRRARRRRALAAAVRPKGRADRRPLRRPADDPDLGPQGRGRRLWRAHPRRRRRRLRRLVRGGQVHQLGRVARLQEARDAVRRPPRARRRARRRRGRRRRGATSTRSPSTPPASPTPSPASAPRSRRRSCWRRRRSRRRGSASCSTSTATRRAPTPSPASPHRTC